MGGVDVKILEAFKDIEMGKSALIGLFILAMITIVMLMILNYVKSLKGLRKTYLKLSVNIRGIELEFKNLDNLDSEKDSLKTKLKEIPMVEVQNHKDCVQNKFYDKFKKNRK